MVILIVMLSVHGCPFISYYVRVYSYVTSNAIARYVAIDTYVFSYTGLYMYLEVNCN